VTTVSAIAPVVTTPVPAIDAAAFAVYDPAAQRWLAESNADEPRAVGSVMKLLSAYVAMRAGDPDRLVTVPPLNLDLEESAIGLREGEEYTRALLLRAMLIVSANDAALTLAIDISGSEAAFVDQMNVAAQQLGLANTVAANPVGLDDPAAHSSARDVAQLAATLLQDATFRQTVARRSATLHGTAFDATNDLLDTYEGADGVKTGRTTQAGWCVVASATRGGHQLIVVVLGASSDAARFASATALLDWAFEQI
jgi:D-alanyl-D-alanine carboxypeptidase